MLRGINWFGWSVGSFNFDGMWAYCDDNTTDSQPPCQQDGDIPPYGVVDKQWSPAVGEAGQRLLNISYWGKRRMTNDFASIVYRIKLLGFNAIRVQFTFSSLNQDIPSDNPEFFPCLVSDQTGQCPVGTAVMCCYTDTPLVLRARGRKLTTCYLMVLHAHVHRACRQACSCNECDCRASWVARD